ncbi:hypothetical protein UlMin_010846 [Ulmus minor]
MIRDTIDKVLVLHFGCASDSVSLLLDDVICKSTWEVSKFVSITLVDIDSEDVGVYVKDFDITFVPSTIFFFNANHMKMDSGDHTKWVGAFQQKQDFIDVVEVGYVFVTKIPIGLPAYFVLMKYYLYKKGTQR